MTMSALASERYSDRIATGPLILVQEILNTRGAGKPALPRGVRTDLELLDERRFASGVVYLGYRVAP